MLLCYYLKSSLFHFLSPIYLCLSSPSYSCCLARWNILNEIRVYTVDFCLKYMIEKNKAKTHYLLRIVNTMFNLIYDTYYNHYTFQEYVFVACPFFHTCSTMTPRNFVYYSAKREATYSLAAECCDTGGKQSHENLIHWCYSTQ